MEHPIMKIYICVEDNGKEKLDLSFQPVTKTGLENDPVLIDLAKKFTTAIDSVFENFTEEETITLRKLLRGYLEGLNHV